MMHIKQFTPKCQLGINENWGLSDVLTCDSGQTSVAVYKYHKEHNFSKICLFTWKICMFLAIVLCI